MTCSRKFGRLLQASCLGLIGTLTIVSCGGSETPASTNKDSGVTDGGGTPPISVSVNSPTLNLGTVDVGKTSSTPSIVTVTNRGTAPVSLAPSVTTGPFTIVATTCDALAAAPGTCTISVSFAPTAVGVASGTLTVSGAVKVSLSGTGAPPASFSVTDKLDLGTVSAGAVVPGRVNVTATTALTDLICSVSSGGNIVADATVVGTCGATLAAGASCVVGFNFSSATAGVKSGDQVVCNAGSVTKTTAITATVVTAAKLVLAPLASTTSATTGGSAEVAFTVSNAGGVNSGAVTGAITPANPEFVVSASTCTPGVAPLGTCSITVTFKPTTAGTKTATLVVTDSLAPLAPLSATITGIANAPSNLSITGVADFGSVAVGTSGTAVAFTVKNTGGVAAPGVTVATSDAQFVIGSDTCTGQTLVATTGTCTLTVTFSPAATATLGPINTIITANSTGGTPFSLPIKGTAIKPPTISITPNPLAFDGISLNVQSEDRTLTVTNTGAASTGALTVPAGLGAGFVISGNTCLAELLPTQTCTIAIRFTPNAIAQATFTLTVTSVSGAIGTAVLTGTGRQPNVLTISPVNVTACSDKTPSATCFVDTAVGQTDGSFPKTPTDASVTFTITNSNTASAGGINLESGPVTVTIGGTNATDFVKVTTNCGPTLQPSQSCTYKVSFKPSAAGARSGTITATSTMGGNVGANLAGVGLPPIEMVPCGYSGTGGTAPVALSVTGGAKAACATALKSGALNTNDHTGLDFGQVSLGADCNPVNVKWFLVTVNSSTAADFMNLVTATLTDPATPANFRIANGSNTDQCNNINFDVSKGAAQCWISVQFRPQGTAQNAKTAIIAASGGSGGSASMNLTGVATGPLTIKPTTAEFGTVVVNEASADTVALTVNNWSTAGTLGPVAIALSGDAAGDYRLVSDSCTGSTLSAQTGTSCTANLTPTLGGCVVEYRFFPAAVGNRAATLTVTAGTVTSTASLHGTGVAETPISAAPATVPFGKIVLSNKSDWQTVTVTAGAGGVETGTLEFDLEGLNVDQFELGTDANAGTCGNTNQQRLGGSNPLSCTIKVRFIPRGNHTTLASGLGDQGTTLVIVDPRDRTLTQKIALTGTGTSQLTIAPTTADFGLIAQGHPVGTTVTFTVTNGGADAIATPALTVAAPFGTTAASTCVNGAGSIAGNGGTCLVVVNWNPTGPQAPGIISANPGVRIAGTSANDSAAAAKLSATVQTDAQLELVGIVNGTTVTAANFGQEISLGAAASNTIGGRATLLFRNSGGHTTSTINYYFWRGITVATPPAGTVGQGAANTADLDFAVVSTGDPSADACVGQALKGGQYCIVQVEFRPTHFGLPSALLAGFELQADTGGSVRAVAFSGRGLNPNAAADKLTITSPFASLIGAPVSVGVTTAAGTPFTITNGSATDTTFTVAASAGFGITSTTCTVAGGGYTLAGGGGNCIVSVNFQPTVATQIFQAGTLTVTVTSSGSSGQTGAFTAGLMGKVREGTVLTIWNPATGVDFGSVPRGAASAPMAFTVMNTGDAPTTGNVTLKISGTGPTTVFNATGCGSALAAFSLTSPSTAATCAAQVILTPTNSLPGPVVTGAGVGIFLEADFAGTNAANAANATMSNLSSPTMLGTCINPASLGFTPTGTFTFTVIQAVGTESTETLVTITNGSSTSSLSVPDFQTTAAVTISLKEGANPATNFVLDLNPPQLAFTNPTCQTAMDQVTGSLILKGNKACVVGIIFAPQAMPATGAAFSATLTATATGSVDANPLVFNGTGRDQLLVTTPTTATQAFGSVVVGQVSTSQTIEITMAGTNTSGLLTTSVTGDFVVVSDTCQGVTLPDLDPVMGQTCDVTLKFKPSSAGAKTGTLTVKGTPGGSASIGLTGTGT